MPDNSLIIVGAGVFGLSTALAWIKTHPSATVFLIDHPSLDPASLDTAKIIRTAYPESAYVELAREAMQKWKSDEIFSKYWHESGWVVVHPEEIVSITRGTTISHDRFLHLFPDARLDKDDIFTEDPASGWVEATKTMDRVLHTAIDAGVIYVQQEVVGLLWDDQKCLGVCLENDKYLYSSFTILAMGNWTPEFLRRCDIDFGGSAFQRAGVAVLGVKLTDAQYERYRDMPIVAVTGLGEIMPPTSDKIMKVNNSISFEISGIPQAKRTLNASSPFFEENAALLRKYFPELSDAPIAFRRYCYDGVAKNQDFIITSIPHRQHLFTAFGGSFHSWKFLPTIGYYIGQLLEGQLSTSLEKIWSGSGGGVNIHEAIIPRRPFPEEASK